VAEAVGVPVEPEAHRAARSSSSPGARKTLLDRAWALDLTRRLCRRASNASARASRRPRHEGVESRVIYPYMVITLEAA
jgi:hypothetical protein